MRGADPAQTRESARYMNRPSAIAISSSFAAGHGCEREGAAVARRRLDLTSLARRRGGDRLVSEIPRHAMLTNHNASK